MITTVVYIPPTPSPTVMITDKKDSIIIVYIILLVGLVVAVPLSLVLIREIFFIKRKKLLKRKGIDIRQ